MEQHFFILFHLENLCGSAPKLNVIIHLILPYPFSQSFPSHHLSAPVLLFCCLLPSGPFFFHGTRAAWVTQRAQVGDYGRTLNLNSRTSGSEYWWEDLLLWHIIIQCLKTQRCRPVRVPRRTDRQWQSTHTEWLSTTPSDCGSQNSSRDPAVYISIYQSSCVN